MIVKYLGTGYQPKTRYRKHIQSTLLDVRNSTHKLTLRLSDNLLISGFYTRYKHFPGNVEIIIHLIFSCHSN